MTKLILVRHGHVEGIDPVRFRGRTDVPLTELGRRQAGAAGERIAARWAPDAIFTSPLCRCTETGAAIARATGVAAQVLPALSDIDYGAWTWKSYDEAREQSPGLFGRWLAAPHLMRFPEGESLQDLAARGADAVRTALDVQPDGQVVLVGHDSINRAILLQLLDQPLSAYWRLEQSPCAINEIDIADNAVTVLRINDTAHLDKP
jgi:broad specificity phosphatase PhoE